MIYNQKSNKTFIKKLLIVYDSTPLRSTIFFSINIDVDPSERLLWLDCQYLWMRPQKKSILFPHSHRRF